MSEFDVNERTEFASSRGFFRKKKNPRRAGFDVNEWAKLASSRGFCTHTRKGVDDMDPREFPTKGNLMLAKNSLALARQGYDLMDKKRNVLLKELMALIDEAKEIQEQIDSTFTKAYACLQRANIEHGISKVQQLAFTVPIEESIRIQTRSIMGTEIPHVKYDEKENNLTYSFSTTSESIDIAREAFREVKDLTIKLSMVENSAYRLASNIKKTQKRANALKNITIPMYTNLVHNINNALEEKEREEFTRLKVIKNMKRA